MTTLSILLVFIFLFFWQHFTVYVLEGKGGWVSFNISIDIQEDFSGSSNVHHVSLSRAPTKQMQREGEEERLLMISNELNKRGSPNCYHRMIILALASQMKHTFKRLNIYWTSSLCALQGRKKPQFIEYCLKLLIYQLYFALLSSSLPW